MDSSFRYQNLMLQLPVYKYFKTTGLQTSKALGPLGSWGPGLGLWGPWTLGPLDSWAFRLLGTKALGHLGSNQVVVSASQ
jgi:hypothetical protein